jgi:ABC-type uncharacterized transport system involved in gliding motility auxiliary subunit
MSDAPTNRPSFTSGARWKAAFAVLVSLAAALAIVVMLNHISRNYFFYRAFLSSQTRVELSPQTLSLLKAITNRVQVTLYYDKDAPMFTAVKSLVNEYHQANPKITVETVDYTRNAAAAQLVKAKYKLNSPTDKNLVIFDCSDKVRVVNGDALTEYTLEQVPNDKEREFRKRPVSFKGEMMFSATLLSLTSSKPLRACYLVGHGEHLVDAGDDQAGFGKFVAVVLQNYVRVEPLSLLGTNTIPADCAFLIIAGPQSAYPESELNKISRYLQEGGRLLALIDCTSADKYLGLEPLLEKWGVNVGRQIIKDEQNSIRGADVIISNFARHPVVNALLGSRIHVILPRPVSRIEPGAGTAEAPNVTELAFTSTLSVLSGGTNAPQTYPVAVAVEKGAVKGTLNERGTTRIVVIGDSLLFGNQMLDSAANRDFLVYAVNWLLDRSQLLQGLGPRPVSEYRIVMTLAQLKSAQWLLLALYPGVILMMGLLVWLRRRS